MRFALKMVLAAVLMGLDLPARAALADANLVDYIEAIVGDSVITYWPIQSILLERLEHDEALKAEARTAPERYFSDLARQKSEILKGMEEEKMILHEFTTAGFKIPESIIEEHVQDRIREKFHDDRVEMNKELQREGMTYEDFKQRLHDRFIVELMQYKFVPEPIISPLKVETYYQSHTNDYKAKDELKMRMIVLNKSEDDTNGAVRRRMEEIQSQIKDGAAISDLARSYSEGAYRSEGGETGWQDTSSYNTALIEAVNKLKPGEYSGVIESRDAYFLVLLEERRPARILPLRDVRATIEIILRGKEKARLWDRWIARLRRKTFVLNF